MKAKVCSPMRGSEFGLRMDSSSLRIHKQKDDSEMHDCFMKLRELVPTVSAADKKLSKVQLLQHVIDYIMDLEITLEHQHGPAHSHSQALLVAAAGFERKPLAESSYFNTMASHMEAIQLSECESRPVS